MIAEILNIRISYQNSRMITNHMGRVPHKQVSPVEVEVEAKVEVKGVAKKNAVPYVLFLLSHLESIGSETFLCLPSTIGRVL